MAGQHRLHEAQRNLESAQNAHNRSATAWSVHGVWTSRKSQFALIAVLAILTSLPYLNTLHNGFVYDDSSQVLSNPYIRNFHHLREIFTTTVWSYRGGREAATVYYRPLMTLLYLGCFQLAGAAAWLYHLASILFNAAAVVAVFLLTERMFGNRPLAFAAAAIFALHPIHSEAVAWVAAVTDLQVSFFYVLTFWLFLGLPQRNSRQAVLAQAAMSASFLLCLLSKESAVTLPLLAAIYEHFYRDDRLRIRWPEKLRRYGLLWVLLLGYLVFHFYFLGMVKATRPMALQEAAFSVVGLVAQYLWKFLWPVRLCAFYVFPDDLLTLFKQVPAGLLALGVLALLFRYLWRHARQVSFGLIWFLVTLAPVLNARWMPANVFSERYLYLPSVGLCWVLGWGCTRLFEAIRKPVRPTWRRAVATALAILGALSVFRIVTRNRDWHDEVTFYRSTLAVSPDSVQMRNNLGQVYYNRGDYAAAEQEWLLAQKIAPNYPVLLDNLGLVYTQEQRYDEAVAVLLRCLRLVPTDPVAHVNLGEAYYQTGNLQLAEKELRTAVSLAPLFVRARISLGEFYFAQARYDEAAGQFRRSIESVPTAKGYLGEGLAYFQLGNSEKAQSDLQKAEALDPASSRPHFVLGFFYAETGRPRQAIEEYESGFRIDPDNAAARAAFLKLKGQVPGMR